MVVVMTTSDDRRVVAHVISDSDASDVPRLSITSNKTRYQHIIIIAHWFIYKKQMAHYTDERLNLLLFDKGVYRA